MYKAIYKVQGDCIDGDKNAIFSPFINCYYLHSVTIIYNGIIYQEEIDFTINEYFTQWNFDIEKMECDVYTYEINYYYIRAEDPNILKFIVDNRYANPSKTNEIISKHYVEGQFCLDNGLYKNAVLNFGTTLEGLLNFELKSIKLDDLIRKYTGNASKNKMHFLRRLRNKVHTNKIINNNDVSRMEAVKARNELELIIRNLILD